MSNTYARQRQIVGTADAWAANDLILGEGELALVREDDGSVRARVGDGSVAFSAAPYLMSSVAVFTYKGNTDPTDPPPAGAMPGDIYTATPGGTVDASWGPPAAGMTVDEGDFLILADDGSWHVQNNTTPEPTFIQAGAGAVTRPALSKMRDAVSVEDFGAVGDGVTDDTAAFHAAFATGRTVHTDAKTYKVGTLNIPGFNGFQFIGSGARRTILLAAAANQPIIRKELVAGACEHFRIGGFSLKAAPTGSTGPAFDCSGFRDGTIFDVDGLSNGSAGFNALFDASAAPYMTYGVVWDKCGLAAQTGFAHVWRFHNNGTGSAGNANACEIRAPWVYANAGLTFGIDAARSALTRLVGGLFEANTGATAVRVGSTMQINGVWFELNAAHIAFGLMADGNGNGSFITGNVFSDAKTIDLTGLEANVWINNTEFGRQTWTGNGGNNIKLNLTPGNPSAPTLTFGQGQAGALAHDTSMMTSIPNLSGEWTYRIRWAWTPTVATSQSMLNIVPPAGFTLVTASAGVDAMNSGIPLAAAISIQPNSLWILNTVADTYLVTVLITIRKTDTVADLLDWPPMITALRDEALALLPPEALAKKAKPKTKAKR